MIKHNNAILVLADGTMMPGRSIGVAGLAVGEVVFNTAMSGYQEILTDPSYAGQLVTLTAAHVGNVGVNAQDMESAKAQAGGLIVRDCPRQWHNWRGRYSLPQFLRDENVVAISNVDTRALTRRLRDDGAMGGCILALADDHQASITAEHEQQALQAARDCPAMLGQDLAPQVSCHSAYEWREGSINWLHSQAPVTRTGTRFRVVVLDYGVKYNILRLLHDHGCELTVVPANTSADAVLALHPDGVFLANGPGDPSACDHAITTVRRLLEQGLPMFGICMGHQLLALAMGARTLKMKFGHHGANHPVQDLATGQVLISSQNHGFAVDESSLPDSLQATHRSLFDGSLQGIAHRELPVFGFQGHPEASPGPHDMNGLFQRFVRSMEQHNA
ncbi:MAG: glutamine-hydrolyzing carbamoyl-phosphate synthase small subunit [Gammaproteobacteria bacterium]|jgi:carbamoyl-phosphate synthase small subunit|nr:glutamine-hydrolyzing carbamoyl-phosphate synthase small subunit [Gammaproteobacteria bacterium]